MSNHANRRSVGMKTFVAMLALVLVIGCAVGGTVAWLTAQTGPVVNTFTYGDIDIELTETKPENQQAKIIPGVDIEKDPKVTVKANSEACYLFVKVEQTGNFVDGKVSYSIADGWTALEGENGVYYREVAATTADMDFYVLKNNKITVSDELTKGDIQNLSGANKTPKLTFTAYAVQQDGIVDADTAWTKANPTTNP